MNYIGCFNRSRDGLQVCSPFFFVWCLDVSRCGVLPVAPLRRSWCLDAARLGVLPVAPLRRSWCASMLPGVECCPLHRCAVPGASMLPGLECCPLHRCAVPGAPQCCQVWSVAAGAPFAPFLVRLNAARRGMLHPCTVSPVLVRLKWCPLCYVIHIIVFHRF